MCGSTTHLGKGARCAPPLHPPDDGDFWVSNPSIASKTYRRFTTRKPWRRPSPPAPNHGPALRRWTRSEAIAPLETHSQETSLSLHPSTWRAFLPPRPQTISWRRFHPDRASELSRYPFLEPCHRLWSFCAAWNPHSSNHERIGCRYLVERRSRAAPTSKLY